MGKILILRGQSQYNVLCYFADSLYKELKKLKETKLIDMKASNFEQLLNEEVKNGIDLTIGFNLCVVPQMYNTLKISHLAILVDHPIYHYPHFDLNSKKLYISCTDKERVDFLQSTLNFKNSFVLHHAVDNEIQNNIYGKKDYGLVMLGGIESSNKMRERFKEKYKSNQLLFEIIEDVTEIATNNSIFTVESLFDSVVLERNVDLGNSNNILTLYNIVLPDIEIYLRTLSREKAIKDFSEFGIHIFGNCDGEAFSNSEKIIVHNAVDNMEGLEILKNSKISLNCTKSIYNGTHERPLLSGACGSVILTNKTEYFKNVFGNSAIYYNDCLLSEAKEQVEEVLNNDTLRTNMCREANKIVMRDHTWKNRAEQIISLL